MIVKSNKNFAFFLIGSHLGLFLLILFFFSAYEFRFKNKVYSGVKVAGVNFGGKTEDEVKDYFEAQNAQFKSLTFAFVFSTKGGEKIATISGEKLKVGFDGKLLGKQASLVGRSGNVASAFYQKWAAGRGKIDLSPSFKFEDSVLDKFLEERSQEIDIPAKEALFQFSGGRVTAFRPSESGQQLDKEKARQDFAKFVSPPASGMIKLSVILVEPKVKTGQANNLGIRELLGQGESFFRGSIAARVYNISLAASKFNGLLIAPDEVFSFNEALGEVSADTGYKQAYVIKEKKTVLDDGGGVCQVSTTLFRAALSAGLPIEERQAHAYRVSYYEQGGFGPGLDATVYAPRVNLKIKNDTKAFILIQTMTDTKNAALVFDLYGAADGRQVTIGKPKITDQVPPPPDLYQDDPILQKGQTKQIDFPAWGGKASFEYKVLKGEEVLQNRTFYSNFQPWQAVYLRGTKE